MTEDTQPTHNNRTRPLRHRDDPDRTILSGEPTRPVDIRSTEPIQPTRRSGPPPGWSPPPVSSPPPRPPWFLKAVIVVGSSLLLLTVLILSSGALGYFWIASQLPPAAELQKRSAQFATTQIMDREGNLLYEIIDPTGGRRTLVTLDQVSPHLVKATVATEDRFFYHNVGVDPIAIGRALYYNLTEQEIVSGASTITQQLARNILLSPEERNQRTLSRKIREAVLAVEINRRYTKNQILEIYLNQIYYGNLAYGIEAAAQTYFGKPARDLTLPEASLLAGLPQSPALHDPYVNPQAAQARQATVLDLMAEAGYITQTEAELAKNMELTFRPLDAAFEAPHFVTYVRQELEKIIDPAYIYRAGLQVRTTLDPRLQAIAEEEVRRHVNALAGRNVSNGALVALDVETGQILAMVGSKDFRDESLAGQVNMVTAPRQPGSTIKPLTYLAAFERLDWTPSTLLMDTPVEYPDGSGGVYRPKNYDEEFHGPVSLRVALATSYNIPAVKTLEAVGVEALKEMAARLGITTLTGQQYGLSLTLGSGETPLIEMTGAYQALANQGMLIPPSAILQISDNAQPVFTQQQPQTWRVLRPEHAYLMTHILADNESRAIAFGLNNPLRLSRPAAAKTGTTDRFRDSWTIGYTPDIVAGVWVGNADNSPMQEVSGLVGAAPIWHNFMERAHEGRPIRDFTRPETIIELEVCADSGTIPSSVCPERHKELFFQEQPPLGPEHDLYQLIAIDRNTGLRANEFCQSNVEERLYQVYPPDGRQWAIEQGIPQPPEEYCPSTNIVARITSPQDGRAVRETIALEGSAMAANFAHYQIEVGQGTEPHEFRVVHGPIYQRVEHGVLGVFDTTRLTNGPYTVRLRVFDQSGGAFQDRVRILVDNSLPTPTAIPSPTPRIVPQPIMDIATPTPAAQPLIPFQPISPTLPVEIK